ncbi:hypothetical protein Leryth_010924 [Lithospermum erythrorhizon]|uniref:Bifunctional inhibitor/plant lipid transfer protein/seed storage helical domain-containing protein n=1 Tax=Lithospermum erythrorhizon TaxID=34254 RepID=A0AAV3QD07_LITER|nr:hypothetical protein Leryth_010924 [Lithospermum erythrorhizon]
MEQNYVTRPLAYILMIFLLINNVASDITQDKEKCTEPLIGLATCLPYVAGDGQAQTPTSDCCTGLNQVMVKSKECVCILIKDRNDPSLGLKVNVSLALNLPIKCHSKDPNLSECPALLHLPANSSDAKVFDEFARSLKKNNSTSHATSANVNGTSSASAKGSGTSVPSEGQRRNIFQYEMAMGLLLVVFFTSFVITFD